MGHDQPMQSNSQEQFVQIPRDIESHLNSDTNHRRNKWLTIIICITLAVIGQSVVRLLENYYFLHRTRKYRYDLWTQSLLQFVGFPILLIPYVLLHLSCNKEKQRIMTSDAISRILALAIVSPFLAIFMFFQGMSSNLKHGMPFSVFTLTYTTQLVFTPSISAYTNKIKLNRWMIISLFFAIITGSFTLYTFSTGWSVNIGRRQKSRGVYAVLCAAFAFSMTLCLMRSVFDSICTIPTNKKQPSFAVVLELLIFLSLFATLISLAVVFISGEHHSLKKRMDGFSKGEAAFVRTLVGQVVAWQVYWVGIVGLVFTVSPVFSNVISVCTWPIVSLLVAVFYSTYNVLSGTALATAALSVASYLYLIHKDKSNSDEPRINY